MGKKLEAVVCFGAINKNLTNLQGCKSPLYEVFIIIEVDFRAKHRR